VYELWIPATLYAVQYTVHRQKRMRKIKLLYIWTFCFNTDLVSTVTLGVFSKFWSVLCSVFSKTCNNVTRYWWREDRSGEVHRSIHTVTKQPQTTDSAPVSRLLQDQRQKNYRRQAAYMYCSHVSIIVSKLCSTRHADIRWSFVLCVTMCIYSN